MSKDRAVLFRFLKDEGIYNRFLEYISTPRCWNMQVGDDRFKDWWVQFNGELEYSKKISPKLLDYAIKCWGLKYIISALITWDKHLPNEKYSFISKNIQK